MINQNVTAGDFTESIDDFHYQKFDTEGNTYSIDSKSLFEYKEGKEKPIYVADAYGKTLQFEARNQELEKVFNSSNRNISLDGFRLPNGSSGTLILQKTKPIIDQSTEFYFAGKRVIAPDVSSYIGFIEGSNDSEVFLTSYKGELIGSIYTGDGLQYNLGRVVEKNSTSLQSQDLYIIKEEDYHLESELGFQFCGVSDEEAISAGSQFMNDKKIGAIKNADGLIEVQLIVVGGYDYLRIVLGREGIFPFAEQDTTFEQWANNPENNTEYMLGMEKATAYLLTVMEMSSRIYEKQTGTTFKINQLRMESYEDPLYNLMKKDNRVDASVKLFALGEYWEKKTGASDYRNFVVLFTDHRSAGSNILGIAMGGEPRRGNYCNINRSYCVVGINYDYRSINYNTSGDIRTTTHEIGHLCGVPHTHNEYFFVQNPQPTVRDTCVTRGNGSGGTAVDGFVINPSLRSPRPGPLNPNTYGTIMSYCSYGRGQFRNNFHPYIAQNLIRIAAERADCLDNPQEPMIRLTGFWGGETISSGKNLITWTSHGISKVDIRYSIEGGDWIELTEGLNASFGKVQWDIQFETDDLRIEIYDSDRTRDTISRHYDVSNAGITVVNKFISITSPLENSQVSNSIDYFITWEGSEIDDYVIEYAVGSTSTWQLIGESENNGILWDAPDGYEGMVRVRVKDKSDGAVADIVEVNVGTPDGIILSPENGYESAEIRDRLSFQFLTDYVEEVTFEFSTDNGQSYRNVQNIGEAVVPTFENDFYTWDNYSTMNGGPNNDFRIRMSAYDRDGDNIILDEVTIAIVPGVNSVSNSRINSTKFNIESVTPNPVVSNTTVILNNTISIGDALIKLYDSKGTLVYENSQFINGESQFDLDLNSYPNGMYSLVIQSGEYIASSKVSVIR
ncbi:MAG: hypothetical protein Kapaf2KO_16730 [Candidatus Kapaibacteriales bacterium]